MGCPQIALPSDTTRPASGSPSGFSAVLRFRRDNSAHRPARYLLDAIHRAYQPRAQIYSISPSAIFHRPTAVHSLLSAASFH